LRDVDGNVLYRSLLGLASRERNMWTIATNSLREFTSGFAEDLAGTKLRSFQSPVLVNFRIAGSRENPPYLSIPRGNSHLRSAEPSSTIGENRSEKTKRRLHTEYFGTILKHKSPEHREGSTRMQIHEAFKDLAGGALARS
jgi:hypothetical protein